MSDFYTAALRKISIEGLATIVKDCEGRIGSHVAGGSPDDHYVERNIISMVQDELAKRHGNR